MAPQFQNWVLSYITHFVQLVIAWFAQLIRSREAVEVTTIKNDGTINNPRSTPLTPIYAPSQHGWRPKNMVDLKSLTIKFIGGDQNRSFFDLTPTTVVTEDIRPYNSLFNDAGKSGTE